MTMISSILDGLRKNSLQAANSQQVSSATWMRGSSLKPATSSLSDENGEAEEEEPVGDGYVFLKKTGILRRKSAPEAKLTNTITTYLKKQSLPVNPPQIMLPVNSPEHERKKRDKSPAKNSSASSTPRSIKRRKRVIRSKSELPPISRKSSLRELISKASRKMSREDGKQTNPDDDQQCTEEQVLAWKISLENILADPLGLKCFHEFLKKEFSEENLLFWKSCERFKEIQNEEEMSRTAQEMFTSYLSRDAPFMVNIDSEAWKKTESELLAPHNAMFETAQQQVFTLMKFDGYARFLKSTTYSDKLEECKKNSACGKGGGGSSKNGKMKWMGGRQRIRSDSDLTSTKDDLKRKKSLDSILAVAQEEGRDTDMDFNNLLPFDKMMKQDVTSSIRIVRKGKSPSDKLRVRRKKSLGCDNASFRNPDPESGKCDSVVQVVLPDGTSTCLCSSKHKTIREGLEHLAREMNFWLHDYNVTASETCDVTSDENDVTMEERTDVTLDTDVSNMHGNVVYLERKSPSLQIDLPNGRSVDINTHKDQTLGDAIEPVMKAIGCEPDTYTIMEIKDRKSYKVVEINTQNSYDVTEIKRRVPVSLDFPAISFRNRRLVAEITDKISPVEMMEIQDQKEMLELDQSLDSINHEIQSLNQLSSSTPNKLHIRPPKITIRSDSQSSSVDEVKSGITSPVDAMFYSGYGCADSTTGCPGNIHTDCSHSLPCQKCCLRRLDDITTKLRNVPFETPSQPLSPSFDSTHHGTENSQICGNPETPLESPDSSLRHSGCEDVIMLRYRAGSRNRPAPVMNLDESQVSNMFYREKVKEGQSDDEVTGPSEYSTTEEHNDGRRGVWDYRREDSGIDTTPSNSDDNLNRNDDLDDVKSNHSLSENTTPCTTKRTLNTTTSTTMITTTTMSTFENGLTKPNRTLTRGHTIDVVGNRVSSRSVHFFRQFSLCDGVLINSVSMENAFFVPNVVPMKGTRGIVQVEDNHAREGIGTENVTYV